MRKFIRPLIFKTDNSYYMYDDATRISLPITESEKIFLEEKLPNLDKLSNDSNEIYSNIINKINTYRLFERRQDIMKFSEETITSSIKKNGINSLLLTVDDSCNLRCKYCYFSDEYEHTHTYSSSKMDFNTAKKAVDLYMENNTNALPSNPNLKFTIGFYGGEPLLNWDVIKSTVEYCKTKYSDIFSEMIFPITTNGILLNEEKIDYMIKNNFFIAISLDGNRYEHDRNRVDLSGKGTYEKVLKNIKLLDNKLKEHDNNKIKSTYSILITFDNKTNLIELNNFFDENAWLADRITGINKVSPFNTGYYRDQSDEVTIKNFISMQETLIDIFKQKKPKERNKFLTVYIRQLFSFIHSQENFVTNPLRGGCIPGEGKLHVDSEGKLHPCEKINRAYSFGTLETGLNVNKQLEIINKYLKFLEDNGCNDCNISNICGICYATVQTSDSKFSISKKSCKSAKLHVKQMFEYYYKALEENINLLEV